VPAAWLGGRARVPPRPRASRGRGRGRGRGESHVAAKPSLFQSLSLPRGNQGRPRVHVAAKHAPCQSLSLPGGDRGRVVVRVAAERSLIRTTPTAVSQIAATTGKPARPGSYAASASHSRPTPPPGCAESVVSRGEPRERPNRSGTRQRSIKPGDSGPHWLAASSVGSHTWRP